MNGNNKNLKDFYLEHTWYKINIRGMTSWVVDINNVIDFLMVIIKILNI